MPGQCFQHWLGIVILPSLVGCYNCGAGALQASTLRRRINSRDWPRAQAEMRRWVRGGGRVLPGLVTRRAIEAGMLV